jgi:hypothetical protein
MGQYSVGGLHANNLTGLQAGIYICTLDTATASDNIHVRMGLLKKQIFCMYGNSVLLVDLVLRQKRTELR